MKFPKLKTLVVTVSISLATLPAFAEWWGSVGVAPSSDGGGTSLAIGGKGAGNWGFELGAVLNSEFNSSNLLDYPVPHSLYTNLGTKRTGSAFGLDALYFFGDSKTIQPYAGVGVYFSPRKEIARSNATGWYYTQSDQSATQVGASIGLHSITESGYILGVGYHSVRGAQLTVGKAL